MLYNKFVKVIPLQKIINKINKTEGFKEWFISMYNSTNDMSIIKEECLKHPFFSRIRKTSIHPRICELRKLFNLEPKMKELTYNYDRIKGYIIRN